MHNPSPARLFGFFMVHSLVILVWLNLSVICGTLLMWIAVLPWARPPRFSPDVAGILMGAGLWVFTMASALSFGPTIRWVLRAVTGGAGPGLPERGKPDGAGKI